MSFEERRQPSANVTGAASVRKEKHPRSHRTAEGLDG